MTLNEIIIKWKKLCLLALINYKSIIINICTFATKKQNKKQTNRKQQKTSIEYLKQVSCCGMCEITRINYGFIPFFLKYKIIKAMIKNNLFDH